ncbi:PTS mannose/fructose/sorbose transporter subunit IIC [Alkalibacterium pelagium]|jgi:PTS system mannose-specific IIC component|uniref:PTS system, mannose-specific IIC component n=1 Tax=Alkalibacterium pelagium TaxID=426702 RepID=A0A1H7LSN9_9LACT|nr:PTS mannose/fructose/sorbose transporter subunit IIC [Alkalibacterium pelagium]GEN50955.1 PTS mannose/fructose/sorbose transporter subunit IIC [Alkalibacterium pelagium]SEL01879.1 PTS system, mannose-specific IIC component [Alkalibacterium pelagium]
MDIISIVLVVFVAFLAGMEGILDQFQFHQPIVACTLIGLATGNPTQGLLLGGTLQLIALGWMNIGAAVAPDAALASVASAILVTYHGAGVSEGIALAIPLAIAGQVLTIFVRTLTVAIAHAADRKATEGSFRAVEFYHIGALMIQGLRIAIPAAIILAVSPELVTNALNAIPGWLTGGLAVAGGMIVAVGYAMVINMMATPKLWLFFALGFALSAIGELNLIAMGIIGVVLALLYLQFAPEFNQGGGGGGNSSGGDPLDDILNDY